MARRDDMADRLPPAWREGELVRGLLGVVAAQIELLDDEAREVQRAHFWRTALNFPEVAGLGALLDIPPEPGQQRDEYRAWVDALRDTILGFGGPTRDAVRQVVAEYAQRHAEAARLPRLLPPLGDWGSEDDDPPPRLVETPRRWRWVAAPGDGAMEPLQQMTVENRGLDPAPAHFLLRGLAGGPEHSPLLANLTTGEALALATDVPQGSMVALVALPDGTVRASLDGHDITRYLGSIAGLVPGQPWTPAELVTPAQPITLRPGANRIWFMPIARYDVAGLDRYLAALADAAMMQGRYNTARFDAALYYQDPLMHLLVGFQESVPAAFRVDLDARWMLAPRGRTAEALATRERLDFALGRAVTRIRAVGVTSELRLLPSASIQPSPDRLVAMGPKRLRDAGSTGADRLLPRGGSFDTTGFDQTGFR
ncbi:hypothetical protein C8P66_11728 [Humitalea rosea]|uniref:Uncharacterized protein n=1 Tax=Humitalea rosea TaxID=990373 RepID=A0A2W7IWD4_9PROT|nr:hypothetical protein [Humitalea rosea]PZW43003.1 hypothetical protein C8P66_11728 [Humitalea rosea]